MASETNELTFVRCPTCRSLVPASASRCRICNATLEAGGEKSSTSETPPAGSRVRQKTVTASAEEIKSIVGGAASQPPQTKNPAGGSTAAPLQPAPGAQPPAVQQPPSSARPTASAENSPDDEFDPLGAFLQDLDNEGPPVSSANVRPTASQPEHARSAQTKPIEPPISDLFDDDDDDDVDDETLLAAFAADPVQEGDGEDDDDDEFDLFDDPSFEELGAATAKPVAVQEEAPVARPVSKPVPPPARTASARPVEPPPAPIPPQRQAKPEPARPQPQARDAQRQPRPEQKPQQDPRGSQEPRKAQPPHAPRANTQMGMRPKVGGQAARPEAKQGRSPELGQHEHVAPEHKNFDPPVSAPVRTEREAARGSGEQRGERTPNAPQVQKQQQKFQGGQRAPEPRHEQRSEQRPPVAPHREEYAEEESVERTSGSGPRMHKMKPGRLFGWLVSYESPDGRAIELRSGRFFVTGTSIRGSDLILEDQSISTPHALMSINEKGFLLQDLMSERGTFVRSRGEAQYRREEGIIEIKHGDWIRFGDVEFLVTIVPG